MNKTLSLIISQLPDKKYCQLVKFYGEFDKAGFSDVREQLNNVVKTFSGTSLIFDFTDLKYINSEGIGYLMEVHTHLVKADQQLIIVGANDHVKDVFDTIGLSEIMPLYLSVEDFLKA